MNESYYMKFIYNNFSIWKIIKRKIPIIKVELDEYKDDFVFKEDSNSISFKTLEDEELIDKDKYRIVFDTCF